MNNCLNNQLAKALFNDHQDGILVVSQQHNISYVNPAAKAYSPQRRLHSYCINQGKITNEKLKSLSLHVLKNDKSIKKQINSKHYILSPINFEGSPSCLIKFSTRTMLEQVNTNIKMGLCIFDKFGNILEHNDQLNLITKNEPKHITQFTRTPLEQLLNYCDKNQCLATWHATNVVKPSQRNHHYELAISNYQDAYLMQVRDVSRHKILHKELSLLATIDPLTGLANRQVFEDRLSEALKRSKRNKQQVAFVLLDLDNFKQINDSLGHQAGDKLLVTLAERLKKNVRNSDTLARLGGDEFCIIFEQVSSHESLRKKLKLIANQINKPIEIASQKVACKASIGVCLCHGELDEVEVYKRADAAMYQAKNATRGSIKIHQETELFNQHESISEQLEQQIDYSQFELFFQPSMDTETRELCSIEALLRWRENGKACLPKEFIKVMERSGHFVEIESWVIHEACRCRKTWQEQKVLSDKVPITINISQSYFYYPGFIKHLSNEINRFSLEPSMIELDIKESCVLEGIKKSQKILSELNQLGVKIALDQFGTGVSSICMLHNHPISRIKLDRSLINEPNKQNWQLINGIIQAAHPLKVKVVAEGVECHATLTKLKQECCDAVQGYLLSRPAKFKVMQQFIKNHSL